MPLLKLWRLHLDSSLILPDAVRNLPVGYHLYLWAYGLPTRLATGVLARRLTK